VATRVTGSRRGKALGIALGDRSLTVAEVQSGHGRYEVGRVAEFTFPAGVGLQQPEQLGAALSQFLHDQGFTAKSAVFGLPAKWVLSKHKEVPAADENVLNETLRIQAEGEFSPELKDLVYEYAGGSAGSVLLMAVPGRYVEGAAKVAEAARLQAVGVTPSAAALGAATAGINGEAMVLSVGPVGAEFTVQNGAQPRVLRHLGAASAPPTMLVGELRRSTALFTRNGYTPAGSANGSNGFPSSNGASNVTGSDGSGVYATGAGTAARRELTVWDESSLNPAALQSIGEALGLQIKTGRLQSLGLAEPRDATLPDPSATRGAAAATALALSALDGARPAVDFLHSRLAAPKKQLVERRTVLIAAAAVIAIAFGAWAYIDQQAKARDLAGLKQKLNAVDPERKANENFIKVIGYARGWKANPRYLACLTDLTNSVPPDGQIYLTSFTLTVNQNMRGSFMGKAVNANGREQQNLLALTDRLRATGRFKDVKSGMDMREVKRGGASELTFSVSFVYVPAEGGDTVSAPGAGPAAPVPAAVRTPGNTRRR
jgi:hypothetical protein